MKFKPIIILFFLLCLPIQLLAQKNDTAAYIGAAKIYYNRRDKEKVLEMTRKALAEPNLIGANIVDAWSYRCKSAMMPVMW